MRFKNWLLDEVRLKGLYRQYQQQHQDKPQFVVNQMYKSMIYPNVRHDISPWLQNNKGAGASTAAAHNLTPHDSLATIYQAQTPPDPNATIYQAQMPPVPDGSGQMPNDVVSNAISRAETLMGVRFPRKPRRVTINPAMLTDNTLGRLRVIRFGNVNIMASDDRRHSTHRNLAASRGEGSNEPIILVRQSDGKYDLLDGYHRVSAYFMQAAPPEDAMRVKAGDYTQVDFSKWRPVTFNAYVGFAPLAYPMVPNATMQAPGQPMGQTHTAAMNADSPLHPRHPHHAA